MANGGQSGQQKTQTELEMEEGRRQNARRHDQMYGSPGQTLGADEKATKTGLVEAADGLRLPTVRDQENEQAGANVQAADGLGLPAVANAQAADLLGKPAVKDQQNEQAGANVQAADGLGLLAVANAQAADGLGKPAVKDQQNEQPGANVQASAPVLGEHGSQNAGNNFDHLFKIYDAALDLTAPGLRPRDPLVGGTYSPDEALKLLNSHFFVGKNNQETAIFRINDDRSVTFIPSEQFKLEIQNIFVKPYGGGRAKPIPAEKFWKEEPRRREHITVFKPGGTTNPLEFNLWRGFGVAPQKGWQKQLRLLRHIWEVICRRDREKFRYLIRYLAWMVQNPDKHAEVIIILKSRKQGTGKSALGKVMVDIFGPHGALIDDKERLLGRFTDWLETKCFVLAEEILWAGDLKAADRLKSLITADTIQIERKFGTCRQSCGRCSRPP